MLINEAPSERFDLFVKGLSSLGYNVILDPLESPAARDVVVLWNRIHTHESIAQRYIKSGATVLIVENGWVGDNTYALSKNFHNGVGSWHIGTKSRWEDFGIEVKPWRKSGDHILVVPQRGMGSPGVAMPRDWDQFVIPALKKVTKRPVVLRKPTERTSPFEPALKDCWAVVTWGSGAGIKSIINGVPVFYDMPLWIGGLAANALRWFVPTAEYSIISPYKDEITADLEKTFTGDRTKMLHRLSWAMWKAEEIGSGEAFRCVLL